MTASRDPDRLIPAFLEEGQTVLPDRVYGAVRDEIEDTRQRIPIGLWIAADLNFVALGLAAAAMLVVVLVGFKLLPSLGVGGPTTSASPSPVPSPSRQPSSSPSTFSGYPSGGGHGIDSGSHRVTVDGLPLSFNMPAGWEGREVYMSKNTADGQVAEAVIFWTTFPNGVNYRPPCLLGSSADRSATDIADAVSTVHGTDVISGPTDVSVGGRATKHVRIFLTYNVLEVDYCGPGFFYGWESSSDPRGGAWWDGMIPGDTIRVWIVDVDGKLLFIEAATRWNAGSAVEQEIQQIVDSIQFE